MTRNHARAVSKRDRNFNAKDVLDICGFMRVVDNAFELNDETTEPATLTVLTSFNYVDEHYTYLATGI